MEEPVLSLADLLKDVELVKSRLDALEKNAEVVSVEDVVPDVDHAIKTLEKEVADKIEQSSCGAGLCWFVRTVLPLHKLFQTKSQVPLKTA
jgi:hypothetical protein